VAKIGISEITNVEPNAEIQAKGLSFLILINLK
jgi:hypothetical protein